MVFTNQQLTVSPAVVRATERFVKEQLQHHDASHDYRHIQRVRNNALHIAQAEGCDADALSVIELAALLHDILDWKYGGTKSQSEATIQAFLEPHDMPGPTIQRVISIIQKIGFKEELPTTSTSNGSNPADAAAAGAAGDVQSTNMTARAGIPLEAAVVQDADRLDAIGAIGIARCFTFGGAFKRVLYDPDVPPRDQLTKEQYMAAGQQATTINHFYEKLLKIKGLMKTQEGARLAAQRHAFMEQFLEQFKAEWEGKA